MINKPSLLAVQSFIFSAAGTYWDYRDYIFCLCSNLGIKDASFRLNIEKGGEFVEELRQAARANGFSNIVVTVGLPGDWAGYMLEQINSAKTDWTMPWPGDHIYVNPDELAFVKSLQTGKQLGVDAVIYGHIQDFEYFLDWERIKILYNDPDYVMIEWGHKYRYCENPKLRREAKKAIRNTLPMVPLPGFATYRSSFFKEILSALPNTTRRWQDMEYSPAKSAWKYKLLIPKQCLYRHVHGYWLEGFFKYWPRGGFPQDQRREIQSWYIRTDYDWRKNQPNRLEYKAMCLKRHPYYERYFQKRHPGQFFNGFGQSPFNADWQPSSGFRKRLIIFYRNNIIDILKRIKNYIKAVWKSL